MSTKKKAGPSSGSNIAKKARRRRIGSRPAVSKRHPLIGFIKGTVVIAPGVDLTEPADPYWGLDVEVFEESLKDREPPRGIAPALSALWWVKKGDWDKAHLLVMDAAGPEAAWVHAYLHRAEGDLGNACYWYRKAGKPTALGPLDSEWSAIVEELLAHR